MFGEHFGRHTLQAEVGLDPVLTTAGNICLESITSWNHSEATHVAADWLEIQGNYL